MSFFLYILYSQSLDKFYIGYTENVENRLTQHNTGISTFTAKANDWTLKHTEKFPSRELAMKREQEIKKKKSRKYIQFLIDKTT